MNLDESSILIVWSNILPSVSFTFFFNSYFQLYCIENKQVVHVSEIVPLEYGEPSNNVIKQTTTKFHEKKSVQSFKVKNLIIILILKLDP